MDQEATSPEKKKAGPLDPGATATQPGEKPGEPPKEYEIDIFRDWCKGCGICAAFCPRDCIHMNEAGQPVVDRPERCTGCGWCELHCPDFAISVRECQEKVAGEEAD
jgi:2-oxoglutarate ferredoxin oxidoreductase subunit delta